MTAKVKTKQKSKPSPEEIAELRRQRQLKKDEERQKLIDKGIDPDEVNIPPELRFIKRKMLTVSNVEEPSTSISIMSYNMLAQALIRRKLFPTSGNALKWSTRSQVLFSEIKYYSPDIMCLQEVDYIQFNSYWKKQFQTLGYGTHYYRSGSKNHGLVIAYKSATFINTHVSYINYDREDTGAQLEPSCVTNNVGFLASLEFTPNYRTAHKPKRKGIIIGTTHLFWHPFGTYERTRQAYIVLNKVKEFSRMLEVLDNKGGASSIGEPDSVPNWYTFFAGDFNSQPFDSPYLSITSKPISYEDRAKTVLGCSMSFQYSKNRGKVDKDNGEDGGEEDDGENDGEDNQQEPEADALSVNSSSSEEGGNVEKFGSNQPKDPVPDSFEYTPEQLERINAMETLHNNLDMRAISLYSIGYRSVDPQNSGLDNDRNEPLFSNWAHAWRGLLDYIFVISSWDPSTDQRAVDSLEAVEQDQGVKLLKLLQLPHPKDMGPEPSGQPRAGQFPSDHLCLIAEVGLC